MTLQDEMDEGSPVSAGGWEVPNLRHLRVVEAVGRLANISRAAQEVRLSQPAVTQAVSKIELIVGRSLFDRRQNGTFLTEAGEIYLRRIRRLLA